MSKHQDKFTGAIFRRLWTPAMLSSLGWALSDMADAVVVGQKMGAVGLAAIGLILPIYMINCMLAHGLGLGGSVKYSRLLGQGKKKDALENFAGVFLLSLLLSTTTAILGTIFIEPLLSVLGTTKADGALFEATRDYLQILVLSTPLFYLSNVMNYYLRNDGSQKLAGVGSVVGNLCDITLNILLVLVFGLGTRGAALSTTLGQIITISIYLPGFVSKKHILKFTLPAKKWMSQAFNSLYFGLATSVQYLYQMIFFLVCNNILMRLGGEHGVAVFDVLQNTSYLILYLFEGVGRAMQPILSTYQGEHNYTGKRTVAKYGFVWGILVGGSLITFVEIFPAGMCYLYGIAGTKVQLLCELALRIFGISSLFAGINILICNYYQACENEKASFWLETLRGAILLLPLTFVCSLFGLNLFWLLFPITEIGSLVIFLLLSSNGRYRTQELDKERIFQKTIYSTYTDVMDVCYAMEAFCEKWEADMKQQNIVTMAIEEIGMTILQHGFGGKKDGYIQITVIVEENGDFELHMRDNATTFDPFSLQTKKATKDEDFDMDSMGVLIIKKQAKEFSYRRYQGFNSLVIKI